MTSVSPYGISVPSLIIILTGLALSGYSQGKKAPTWVSQLPISSDAYYGLGISDTRDSKDYRKMARTMALRDIAEKIYVSINSVSELNMNYNKENAEYQLDEIVALETSNFLSGHRKVDEWTDKKSKRYYTLFMLDREIHEKNRETYFDEVKNIVDLINKEADLLFEQGQLIRGINKLVSSIDRLDLEMKKVIEPEYLVTIQKMDLMAKYRLERQLARIEINTQGVYEFRADSNRSLIIPEFVIDRETKAPQENLRTSIRVLKGDLLNYRVDGTNPDLMIKGIYPQNGVTQFQLLTEVPLPEHIRNAIDATIPSKLASKVVTLKFKPYGIAIIHNELNEKGENRKRQLTRHIRSITKDLSLEESDDPHYVILVNTSQSATQTSGYYNGRYEAEIIVKLKSGKEVFRFTFKPEEARARSRHSALSKAYNWSVNDNEQFLNSFISFLCSVQPISL